MCLPQYRQDFADGFIATRSNSDDQCDTAMAGYPGPDHYVRDYELLSRGLPPKHPNGYARGPILFDVVL
jgi:hypothetical protein